MNEGTLLLFSSNYLVSLYFNVYEPLNLLDMFSIIFNFMRQVPLVP